MSDVTDLEAARAVSVALMRDANAIRDDRERVLEIVRAQNDLLRDYASKIQRLETALTSMIDQLDEWARESVKGGWSTHQVDPMRRKAGELRKLLANERNQHEAQT